MHRRIAKFCDAVFAFGEKQYKLKNVEVEECSEISTTIHPVQSWCCSVRCYYSQMEWTQQKQKFAEENSLKSEKIINQHQIQLMEKRKDLPFAWPFSSHATGNAVCLIGCEIVIKDKTFHSTTKPKFSRVEECFQVAPVWHMRAWNTDVKMFIIMNTSTLFWRYLRSKPRLNCSVCLYSNYSYWFLVVWQILLVWHWLCTEGDES